MVLFDLFKVLLFGYILYNYIWANLFKLIFAGLLYYSIELGVLQQRTSQLYEIAKEKMNDNMKEQLEKYSGFSNKFVELCKVQYNNENNWLFLKKCRKYIYDFYVFVMKYIELACDKGEVYLRKNKKADEVLNTTDVFIQNRKKTYNRISGLFSQIDIKQLYGVMKQLEAMQQMYQMQNVVQKVPEQIELEQLEIEDDDVFETTVEETEKISVVKEETEKIVAVNPVSKERSIRIEDFGMMSGLLNSVPPELLKQSMAEVQNLDMSKIDINEMMGELHQMMGQMDKVNKLVKKNKKAKKHRGKKKKV